MDTFVYINIRVYVFACLLLPSHLLPTPPHPNHHPPPPNPKKQTRVDRGLPDDSFILLKPGESWRVGDSARVPFLDRYRDEARLPLSH